MIVTEHRPPLKRIDYAVRRSIEIAAVDEDVYVRAERMCRERRVWDAVTATAQASQQGDE